MAEYTVLDAEQLTTALARFGLPPPTQTRPEPRGAINTGYHVWSGGRRFFLRVNEASAEAALRFEASVHRYLHEARFPVPELVLATDGRPWAEVSGKPASLFTYAPGEELALGDVTPDRCQRLGEEMARLHELGAGFEDERPNPYGRPWVAERIAVLASRHPPDAETAAALPLLEDELSRSARLPGAPRGLVHGDLFLDNVLWIGDRVSALIDWEMSCVEPFAYDLGVALNAWCHDGQYRRERARGLWAGYRARRKVEPETVDDLYDWSRFAALRFAVARLHGYLPAGSGALPPAGKDWREYRDRLAQLRAMGEAGFRSLLGE